MTFYYLGPWQQSTDPFVGTYYHAPPNTVGMVDLRPLSDTPDFGFFATSAPITDPDYKSFSENGATIEDVTMKPAMRSMWQSMVGTGALPTGSLLDTLWATLTTLSDPDGATRAKPLMPTRTGRLDLHLGGHSLVRSRPMRKKATDEPHWEKIQQVLRNDYRSIRAGQSQGGKLHLKWLGAMQGKYNLTPEAARDFIGDKRDGLPLKPETTITESFNTADSTTLGPDLTWAEPGGDTWEISSNTAARSNADSAADDRIARAESDLSSDDHYSEIDVVVLNGHGGACCRIPSGSGTSFYLSFIEASSSNIRLFKVVTSTFTSLASDAAITKSIPDTVRVEADGSTIKSFFNSTEEQSATDTAITGNTRCGIYGLTTGDALDVFEAADVVVSSSSSNALNNPPQHGGALMSLFQEAIRTPAKLAYASNQTTTSTALPASSLVSAGDPADSHPVTGKAVKVWPVGTDASNETGIFAVIGWRKTVGTNATQQWEPELLFQATITLGTDIGVSGGYSDNNNLYADTIASPEGPLGYIVYSPANNERANVEIPHRGCQRISFLFDTNTSSTSLNALFAMGS